MHLILLISVLFSHYTFAQIDVTTLDCAHNKPKDGYQVAKCNLNLNYHVHHHANLKTDNSESCQIFFRKDNSTFFLNAPLNEPIKIYIKYKVGAVCAPIDVFSSDHHYIGIIPLDFDTKLTDQAAEKECAK